MLATVVSVFGSSEASGPDPYRAGLIAAAVVAGLGLAVCLARGVRSAGATAAAGSHQG